MFALKTKSWFELLPIWIYLTAKSLERFCLRKQFSLIKGLPLIQKKTLKAV